MPEHEMNHEWECVPYGEEQSASLASALDIPFALAKVLVGRGIVSESQARAFLNPALAQLTDPFLLSGVSAGIRRVRKAIEAGETIVIYGDYDCDGVVATVLLVDLLRKLGGTVDSFIPERAEDGFGFTLGALDRVLADMQPKLIITADCGMRSADAVDKARQAGVDVLIIDHHRPYGAPLPDAVAVISSLPDDVPEAMQSLSAVGLAFSFCRALIGACRSSGVPGADTVDIWAYLDLVTIGTVTDLMPLTGDNRILVFFGMKMLNDVSKRRPGVLALIRAAGVRTEIGSYEVGFLFGPRLSAAGRIGHADIAVGLLLESDAMEARRMAGRLEACYRERRRIEEGVLREATASADTLLASGKCAIVAVGENWHIGTIGIVAARLCGRYNRPAIVMTYDRDGKSVRGSCRSVPGVDLERVLTQCSDYLLAYGGYGFWAGFSLKKDQVSAFCSAFEKACQQEAGDASFSEQYQVDAWIRLAEADDALLEAIKQLQPLGIGNQTPIWGVRRVRIQGPTSIVGGNHLKCTFVAGGTAVDAIGYGIGDRKLPAEPLDILFQLQRNHYRGRSRLQLSIKDIRSSKE